MLKTVAAREAVKFIKGGSVVGLGSGTTAKEFIKALAESGPSDIVLVATSSDSEIYAYELGLGHKLRPLWAVDKVDVAVDGADEVTRDKVFLKGRGGALLREKIVDYAAEVFIVVVEEYKLVEKVPSRHPIPIEVVTWSWRHVANLIVEKFGGEIGLRYGEGKLGPVVTDNGNYILDWKPPAAVSPNIEEELKLVPGVVESGVFARRRDAKVIVAKEGGSIHIF